MGIVFLMIALHIFNYDSYFHFLLVQSHYIIIILFVIYARKLLFYSVAIITLSHIIADAVVMNKFPTQAVTESIVQTVTAVLLYLLFKQKQTLIERHESVIKATKAGTYEWNLVTNQKIYNNKWAQMIGYTLKEFQQSYQSWEELVKPEDLVHANQVLEKVINGEVDYYHVKIRMRHQLGHYVWIRDQGEIVKWSKEGKPLKMVGTQTDISEEVSLEEEVTQSRDLMKYIIEHNQSAVAVHDNDLKYIYVSQRYLKDYRVIEKDVIGKHHYDVFPDLPQKWRDVHARVLKGEVISGDRDTFIREDGKIDFTRWECRPWYEKDGSIGGIIVYTEVINE